MLLENLILKIPFLNRYYFINATKLKRKFWISLHHFKLLKPYAFVIWLMTYKCNLKCEYCEASANENYIEELTWDNLINLFDDFQNFGVKRVLLSGGEPLMHSHFFQVLSEFRIRKIIPGLLSNGLLVKQYFNDLSKYKFFFYQTSIDGLPEYHDKMRGLSGTFDKAIQSLELFAEIKTPIRIVNSVIHKDNITQMEYLFEYIKNSYATKWQITPLVNVGRASGLNLGLSSEHIKFLNEFIREKSKYFDIAWSESCSYINYFDKKNVTTPFFCGAGLTRCSIMPNGDVIGCNQIYNHSYSEGNIKSRKFSDIWLNEFKTFRSNNFRKECKECEFLKNCQGGCWVEWLLRNSCYKTNYFLDKNTNVI